MIRVLGLDPGFASVGWALVDVTGDSNTVCQLGVWRTARSSGKVRVKATDDNVRRAQEIASYLWEVVKDPALRVVCAESMSFPPSASSAGKLSLCWGVVAAVTQALGLPLVQSSPQEIKKSVVGSSSASKGEVESSLRTLFGSHSSGAIHSFESMVPASQREHAWDALAAVVCGLDSEVVRMARKMLG